MRIYLLSIAFLMSLSSVAQNVETDFDAPDSLYREDQFYVNITYNTLQKRPEGLKQNKLSPGFCVGFLRDMPVNKNRTLSVAAGLGYSLAIYNQNLGITSQDGVTNYQILDSDIAYSKNKFSLHYIDVPIEFRWRNSTIDSHKFWRVYVGLKLSYLFYDQYKLVSSNAIISKANNKDFKDFHYGFYMATGWNTWNIYGYYGMNPLLNSSAKIDGKSIEMNTINFGLMFYIL